jgi:hypothetical protein
MEISCTDHVKNEEVLRRVKEERKILHAIKRRKSKWLGHILRRDRLLKYVLEGRTEGTGSRGKRRKQLLDDLTERIKLKEEALDLTVWRTCYRRGHSSAVGEAA